MTYNVHSTIICLLRTKELKPSMVRSLPQIIDLSSGNLAQSYFKAYGLRRFITPAHCLRY